MARLSLSLLSLLFIALVGTSWSAPADGDLVTALPGLNVKANFKHFSGYLEAGNGQFLHYWFFESQTAHPEKDPVVLWLNGGPGCSSLLGALSELGPIRLSRNGSLSLNPYAWNQKANVLFLESPAGVGFSYKADGHYDQNDSSTAQLNFDALHSFFKKFPHLEENEFYVTGESYAGIYIPTLSMKLLEHKFPKHFKGVAIGNAYLDTHLLGNSVLHYYYYHGMMGSTHWDELVKTCCKGSADTRHCDLTTISDLHCYQARLKATIAAHRARINPYNIYGACLHDPTHNSSVLSYDQVMHRVLLQSLNIQPEEFYAGGHSPPCLSQDYLAQFLNKADTRKALHITEKSWEWYPCRSNINYHRELHSMKTQVKHMVDAGLRVLIYNGDIDSVCNFISDQWFVEELGYRVRVEYHPLIMGDEVIGFSTFYDNQLTFMTVRGAGHMVPEDKPKESLFMFNTFLTGRP